MFGVPDSTSPPSTPDSHRPSRDIPSLPSTTPIGPPPTGFTQNSFTPAGPPPSSVFGSSQLGTANSRIPGPNFGSSKPTNNPSPRSATRTNAFGRAQNSNVFRQSGLRGFTAPGSSPPQDEVEDNVGEREEVEDGDVMDEDIDFASRGAVAKPGRGLQSSQMSISTRSPRKLRLSQSVADTIDLEQTGIIHELDGIAKGIAADLPQSELEEPDQLIIGMDEEIRRLYEDRSTQVPELTSDIVAKLRTLWIKEIENEGGYVRSSTVGPSKDASGLAKATFISNILLQLHHPPLDSARANLSASRFGRSSLASSTGGQRQTTPFPKLLLDWLNGNHDPGAEDLEDVLEETDGYSASEAYWDVLFSTLFRGKFTEAINLLRGANWSVAICAKDVDGYEEPGFDGRELQQTEIAVDRVIRILEDCPAVQYDDWNVTDNEWATWRHKVKQSIVELKEQAKPPPEDSLFGESARFSAYGISTTSRRAPSSLPASILDYLTELLTSLLGDPLEIIKSACDWVEAVIGMTVWWNGEEEVEPVGSLAASRRSLQRSQQSRAVDISPSHSYRGRLNAAVAWILESGESQLEIDTSNAIEVALACVFAGQVDQVLDMLQRWSLPVAAATVEIASAGRWLTPKSISRSLMRTFDQSDLMVLGHGDDSEKISIKDRILVLYAEQLADRDILKDEHSLTSRGWEVAIQILGHLDDAQVANERISDVFDRLPLESEKDVQGMIALCDELDLTDQVKKIAERYAEHLRTSTHLYGPALLYYARAQNAPKIREVLNMLVSHSLVTSRSFPTLEGCDPMLRRLVKTPKAALGELEAVDPEAARLLSIYLSGYATLRRFYDLRDGNASPKLPEEARRREASSAMVAVIESAGESIRGGLYDESVEAVLLVDGLLIALGETLPLLNQGTRSFSLHQTFAILKAVEDLQTVPSRVFEQCEVALQAAITNYHDGSLPESLSPVKGKQQRTLGRSQSSGLTGSQYSLLEGSTGSSQELASVESGSELLVRKPAPGSKQAEKGWDWRKGFARGTSGKDVLAVLRLALAQDVADGWLDEGV